MKILSELDENFLLGLSVGVIALSMIFYRFQGMSERLLFSLNVSFSPLGQFHLVTMDLVLLLIPVAYWRLGFLLDNGKRILASVVFALVVFNFHDIAWLIETFFVPQLYKGGVLISSVTVEEYVYHFSKNFLTLIPGLVLLLRYRVFRLNLKSDIAFGLMLAFHAVNIIYQYNLYILNGSALLVYELIDFAPFVFLVVKESKPDLRSEDEKNFHNPF